MAPEPSSRASKRWLPKAGSPLASRPQSTRRRKIFVILAIMLALIGAITAWFLLIRPFKEPTFLSIALTSYKYEFPVNPFAAADSEALYQDFPKHFTAHDNQPKDQLIKQLKSVADVAEKEGTGLVVHLCGFAKIDRTNGPEKLYLLPGDAEPNKPSTWIPLEQILDILRKCRATNKLLLLDIARPLVDLRRDLQTDDIADRFQTLFQGPVNGSLQVLCACSPGQTSLVSRERGMSLFGYYLHQGLCGQAEGYNPEDKRAGRVSVGELVRFVKARVDRYAIRNRGVRQTPVLLGKGADFDLVALKDFGEAARWHAPVPPAYPTLLAQGWHIRDGWVTGEGNVYQVDPPLVHQLEVLLLTQEQQWRGGSDPREIVKGLQSQIGELPQKPKAPPPEPDKKGEKEKSADAKDKKPAKEKSPPEGDQGKGKKPAGEGEKPPTEPVPMVEAKPVAGGSLGAAAARARNGLPRPRLPSLIAKARHGLKPNADVARELHSLLKKVDEGVKEEKLKGDKTKFVGTFKDVPLEVICWTMLDLVFDDACQSRAQFQLLVDLVREVDPDRDKQSRPAYVEMACLQRLADLGDKYPRWPADEVRLLFKVVKAGSEARLCRPREFAWVRHPLDEADKKRRLGEQLFFGAKKGDLPQARELLGEAQQSYQEINRDLLILRSAHGTFDEAFRLLPAYGPALVVQLGEEGADEKQRAWFNGVREADTLAGLLAQPLQGEKALSADQLVDLLSRLDDQTRKVQKNLTELRQGFQPVNTDQIMKRDAGGQDAATRRTIQALQKIEAVLATACPTAVQREALLGNRLTLAHKLDEETRGLDKDDNQKGRLSTVPENLLPLQAASRTEEPGLRARVVLALLRLAGVPAEDLKKAEQALAEGKKEKTPAWNKVAGVLRQTWDRQRQLLPTLELIPADRLSRILEGAAGQAGGFNPTLALRQRQARAYWEWLGQSFWKDAEDLKDAPAYQELLRETSRVCKQAAQGE